MWRCSRTIRDPVFTRQGRRRGTLVLRAWDPMATEGECRERRRRRHQPARGEGLRRILPCTIVTPARVEAPGRGREDRARQHPTSSTTNGRYPAQHLQVVTIARHLLILTAEQHLLIHTTGLSHPCRPLGAVISIGPLLLRHRTTEPCHPRRRGTTSAQHLRTRMLGMRRCAGEATHPRHQLHLPTGSADGLSHL
jgi:hypothetical protein